MRTIKKKVFVIDDDFELFHEIKPILQCWDIDVDCISIHDVMMQINRSESSLMIINITTNSRICLDLIQRIRAMKVIPILALSYAGAVKRIEVFRAGAHGYLESPYTPEECAEYAKSLMDLYSNLRENRNFGCTLFFEPDFLIDPVRHQVILNGKMLDFTPKEFDLLYYLASHAEQVLSREQLFNAVWDEYAAYHVDELVKAHIKSIRKKLSPYGGEYIKNVRGIGYRFTLRLKKP